MGFWSTLGKIGTTIAPYVAAPFTGGASLALAPMASNLANRIGPSNTMIDRIGGAAGEVAGGYGAGRMGEAIGRHMGGDSWRTPPFNPNAGGMGRMSPTGNGIGNAVGGILGGILNRPQPSVMDHEPGTDFAGNRSGGNGLGGFLGKLFGRGGEPGQVPQGTGPLNNEAFQNRGRGIGPRMNMMRMNLMDSNPHLGGALAQGRNEAIMNQPWRQAEMSPTKMNIMPNVPIGPRRNPMAELMYAGE